VIAGDTIHLVSSGRYPSEDVAAAKNEPDLYTGASHFSNFGCQHEDAVRIQAKRKRTCQSFTGDFE
jgi:hypothetical protein